MSCLGISVVAGLATVGILVGRAGLWRRGLLGPASCGGCRPTAVWQDLPVGPGGPRSWHQPAGGRWGQVQGQSMLVGREAPCVNGLKGGFQNATCIQSINIFFVEQASKNGSHQHLWSCGESQLSPAFSGGSQDQQMALTQNPFNLLFCTEAGSVWDFACTL